MFEAAFVLLVIRLEMKKLPHGRKKAVISFSVIRKKSRVYFFNTEEGVTLLQQSPGPTPNQISDRYCAPCSRPRHNLAGWYGMNWSGNRTPISCNTCLVHPCARNIPDWGRAASPSGTPRRCWPCAALLAFRRLEWWYYRWKAMHTCARYSTFLWKLTGAGGSADRQLQITSDYGWGERA